MCVWGEGEVQGIRRRASVNLWWVRIIWSLNYTLRLRPAGQSVDLVPHPAYYYVWIESLKINPWLSIIIPARGAAETNSNANPEYNDYDEEEPPRSPGNLEKSTPKPLMPYFDQGQVIVYVLPNAQSVKLDCPVKNYDGKWALATPCSLLFLIALNCVFQRCVMRFSGTATTRSSPTVRSPSTRSTAWTRSTV